MTAIEFGRGDMKAAEGAWRGINIVDQQMYLKDSYLKDQLRWPPRVSEALGLMIRIMTVFLLFCTIKSKALERWWCRVGTSAGYLPCVSYPQNDFLISSAVCIQYEAVPQAHHSTDNSIIAVLTIPSEQNVAAAWYRRQRGSEITYIVHGQYYHVVRRFSGCVLYL